MRLARTETFDEETHRRLRDGRTDGAMISGPDKVAVPYGEPAGGEARVLHDGRAKAGYHRE